MVRPSVTIPLLTSLVLVALVLVLYAPVRNYDFVAFDDYDFVVDNPHVAAGLTADGVRWSFTHAYDAAGGPLTWLSYMLDVELFAQKHEIAKAATSFERAIRLRPEDADTYNNLGAMLHRLQRTSDAIAAYRRALELKPEYALARRNLGLALAAHGDVAAGIEACFQAIRDSPKEAAWHYELAVMLLSQARGAEAIVQLNETLRLDPSHEDARQTLAALAKSR